VRSGKSRTFALFHNIGIYWLKKELPRKRQFFLCPILTLLRLIVKK